MQGISSKAMNFGGAENKKRYNGYDLQNKEFSDGSGIEWYDYKHRYYDNQIGRFFCVDELADKYPYYAPDQFAGNEVPNTIDLDGLEPLGNIADMHRAEERGWAQLVKAGYLTRSEADKQIQINRVGEAFGAGMGVLAGLSIFVPQTIPTTAPVVASYVFGVPSPGAPTSVISTASTETSAVVNTIKTETSIATRANQIQSVLPAATQSRTTTAVAAATTQEGNAVTLVASSEINLRPVQRAALQPGEVAVSGKGHAEQTIINHANANGMTVNAVAASRPICTGCATAINNAGAVPASPLKIIKPAVAASTYVKPPVVSPPKLN